MLDLLTSGLSVVFAPKMFILIIFAVFLGTLFGALPGVSATMAVTLGIPFTYKMDAVSAIAFLVAIYCASITGGGMTAILFKIPGVPSSAPVPAIVEGYYGAGRLNHGDIHFDIPDETVVTNGHQQPLPALASILDAYKSGVVKVFLPL